MGFIDQLVPGGPHIVVIDGILWTDLAEYHSLYIMDYYGKSCKRCVLHGAGIDLPTKLGHLFG